ncbi:MAG: alcohol dehydrogenase catalytic domain-containing protein [Novosphingobium sp.]|nr:alcohol dehydrogenase catalytic domain-containing protein [Novosphingobium sp.]
MKRLNIHEVNDVRLDDYVLPNAGPKDVVLKMKACGICGSDLSYIKWGGIMREEGGVTALGHEGAGEVLSVGSEVSGVAVGDAVIVNPMATPSNIGSGGTEGAFVDQLLVREAEKGKSLLPIPEGVSYYVAAMCEPLAVAMHGVNRAQAKAGQKVVVFGCGPIGLGMVLWLADRGVEELIAVDLSDGRLERARALGAKYTINPSREDLREKVMEYHGQGADMIGQPRADTDAFLDAAGAPQIIPQAIRMAKAHARIVITAVYHGDIQTPLGEMLTSEVEITSAIGYPTEMPEVVAAMPRLKDKIASMISHRLPFESVLDGLKIAGTPESAKVMIEFGDA